MRLDLPPDDKRKECCRWTENLKPHTEYGMPKDVVAVKCSVCGCRHFEALADPGQLGILGTDVG